MDISNKTVLVVGTGKSGVAAAKLLACIMGKKGILYRMAMTGFGCGSSSAARIPRN